MASENLKMNCGGHISATARNNSSIFSPNMARNIIRFKPPIGMFSRLLVETAGEGRGKLDLKKGGLFALTRGISLIALEEGICGGTTWSKIERLRQLPHRCPERPGRSGRSHSPF